MSDSTTTFFILYGPYGDIVAHNSDAEVAGFLHRSIQDNRCFPMSKKDATKIINQMAPGKYYRFGKGRELRAIENPDDTTKRTAVKCQILAYGYTYLALELQRFVDRFSYTESIIGSLDLYLCDQNKYIQTYASALGIDFKIAESQVQFDIQSVVQVRNKAFEHKVKYSALLRNVESASDLQAWMDDVTKSIHEIGML